MNKTQFQHNLKNRQGFIKLIIVLLIVLVIIFAGLYYSGSSNQQNQENYLADGYENFRKENYTKAFENFANAKNTFGLSLSFYRKIKGSDIYVTSDELVELLISTCLTAAHDIFFKLKPAPGWVEKAQNILEQNNLANPEQNKELVQLVNTAAEISELCKTYNEGEYEEAFRELKKVEENALQTDRDFFIFEIRFLIACGKALNEPAILTHARELLFFATTDAGINNKKTQRLWGILTN
ncbi:MAG: hypothetical protein ACQETH_15140 [Candidatus Rifleibacteriota bacterium]